MKKTVLLITLFLIALPFISCKRDSFEIPEFTSPSTLDYYVLINVDKTVLNPGNSTAIKVKVVGPNGKPLSGVKVKLRLQLDGSSTKASLYAYLKNNSLLTNASGEATTTLFTYVQMVYYAIPIDIYAWVGSDPVEYSNRTVIANARVYIIPTF